MLLPTETYVESIGTTEPQAIACDSRSSSRTKSRSGKTSSAIQMPPYLVVAVNDLFAELPFSKLTLAEWSDSSLVMEAYRESLDRLAQAVTERDLLIASIFRAALRNETEADPLDSEALVRKQADSVIRQLRPVEIAKLHEVIPSASITPRHRWQLLRARLVACTAQIIEGVFDACDLVVQAGIGGKAVFRGPDFCVLAYARSVVSDRVLASHETSTVERVHRPGLFINRTIDTVTINRTREIETTSAQERHIHGLPEPTVHTFPVPGQPMPARIRQCADAIPVWLHKATTVITAPDYVKQVKTVPLGRRVQTLMDTRQERHVERRVNWETMKTVGTGLAVGVGAVGLAAVAVIGGIAALGATAASAVASDPAILIGPYLVAGWEPCELLT